MLLTRRIMDVICPCVFLVALFFDLLVSQEEPVSDLYLYFFSAMLMMVLIRSMISYVATSSSFKIQDSEDLASRTKLSCKVLRLAYHHADGYQSCLPVKELCFRKSFLLDDVINLTDLLRNEVKLLEVLIAKEASVDCIFL